MTVTAAAVRVAAARGGCAAGLAAAGLDGPDDAGRLAPRILLALRLGLSEGLLEAAAGRLGSRTVAGSPLIGNPLVRAQLAEVFAEQRAVRAHLELSGRADDAGWAALQRRVTDADRALLRLLGASGYLQDGPGRPASDSEQLLVSWTAGRRPAS